MVNVFSCWYTYEILELLTKMLRINFISTLFSEALLNVLYLILFTYSNNYFLSIILPQ